MKGKFALAIVLLMLICGVSSAQVLIRKSPLFPAFKNHEIHLAGSSFAQNTATGDTLIVWFDSLW
jgi:hypothetical protein